MFIIKIFIIFIICALLKANELDYNKNSNNNKNNTINKIQINFNNISNIINDNINFNNKTTEINTNRTNNSHEILNFDSNTNPQEVSK